MSILLRRERERRRQAAEQKRGQRAAKGNPASIELRYLDISARTKNPLLARYGQDVTLGELAKEPNLTAVVNGFGPAGAAELAAVMKTCGVLW